MGDVYEGLDRLLRRPVAVKVYRAASPADRARFDAEVHCLASLNHPGLVRVYDAGACGEDAFVVLEFIDGPPLAALIGEAGGPLTSNDVVALGADLGGRTRLHPRAGGVVHRDVTPANVLCGPDGRPRLVDFGIARLLDSPRMTVHRSRSALPPTWRPSRVRGQEVTPAADMYSLGLVRARSPHRTTGVRRLGPGDRHGAARARPRHLPRCAPGMARPLSQAPLPPRAVAASDCR